MKITNNSKKLMFFFTNNKHISKSTQTQRTRHILLDLYKNHTIN